ncbi:AbrB/MazE/SpoVT family DNA-binding domain-containing protein [Candidatus Bathyarchaeota archaeon]|nr:AbrB/MazE/SpoVT family DNA-binding domain-containing protein [Candidatus Bathyarchaeota archaeon]
MSGFPTTRVVSYQAGKYLRTSIPIEIVKALDLKAGDVLAWEIEERDGRKVAVLRKLE